jgi:hypothetical protein
VWTFASESIEFIQKNKMHSIQHLDCVYNAHAMSQIKILIWSTRFKLFGKFKPGLGL